MKNDLWLKFAYGFSQQRTIRQIAGNILNMQAAIDLLV